MTDIIFSFDTEDFTSNIAADAILAEAEIMREEGVRAGFCIVGLLAKQLKKWGRTDILEALSHHDILSHSYGHTLHPTINEYTDIESFDDAYNEVIRQETEGIRLINEFTGNMKIYGACPPGNQKSYVAMYAYADMGLPIYADTVCDTLDGRGMYYCNIYQAKYSYFLEKLLNEVSEEEMKKDLDELAKMKRVIAFSHPNNALFTESWDEVNYYKENHCRFGEWKECKRRSVEQTKRFYDNIRKFVKLVKQDERFNITSYKEMEEKLSKQGERILKKEDFHLINEHLEKTFAPMKAPVSVSLSDMFLAARDILLGKEEHICGKVYGFLDKPYSIAEPVTLNKEDIIASAKTIDAERFLPVQINVGGKVIGPGDWLRAATQILSGKSTVVLNPAPQLPAFDDAPRLKNLSLMGWMQSDSFEDKYLSERLRLQSWTMRLTE